MIMFAGLLFFVLGLNASETISSVNHNVGSLKQLIKNNYYYKQLEVYKDNTVYFNALEDFFKKTTIESKNLKDIVYEPDLWNFLQQKQLNFIPKNELKNCLNSVCTLGTTEIYSASIMSSLKCFLYTVESSKVQRVRKDAYYSFLKCLEQYILNYYQDASYTYKKIIVNAGGFITVYIGDVTGVLLEFNPFADYSVILGMRQTPFLLWFTRWGEQQSNFYYRYTKCLKKIHQLQISH